LQLQVKCCRYIVYFVFNWFFVKGFLNRDFFGRVSIHPYRTVANTISRCIGESLQPYFVSIRISLKKFFIWNGKCGGHNKALSSVLLQISHKMVLVQKGRHPKRPYHNNKWACSQCSAPKHLTFNPTFPRKQKLFSREDKDLVILPLLQEICKDKMKGLLC